MTFVEGGASVHNYACCISYSGTDTPEKRTPHDITDSSERPDCPSIHFNT